MHAPASPQLQKFARTRGEVYVWLCSMGLTVGLVMILFLLGLILLEGLNAFWPKRIAEITLREGAATPGSATGVILGEIVRQQPRRLADEETGKNPLEWQIRTSNRDTFGTSFRWLEEKDVASTTYPANLIEVERTELDNALGFPVELRLDGGAQTIAADSPDFRPQLERLVREANDRRQLIRQIERGDIGRINAEMTRLRNRERALQREGRLTPAWQAETQAKLESLQKDFEELAARARELRAEQETNALVLSLPSGQTLDITTGNIVRYSFPNELSLTGRVGLFFGNFWYFLSESPRQANMAGGIFPAIFGTAVMTVLMSIAVMPFGVIASIYLREYATQGLLVRCVRIAVNNLAGVPSIVFGVFGLGFFVYLAGGTIDQLFFSDSLPTPTFGTGGVFWASLTLALMTVPVVIVATEEALAAVPRGVREGSLACGASKWQTIQRVVLPAAAPGILTGLILAMARGAGEVAPLMLVGVVKLAPSLPIDGDFPFLHLERKFMHLGFHIFDLGFQSPDAEAARPMVFATTLLLILLVVILNLTAIIIRERLRRKYATATF
jgi:phosphate transport system permease protein